MEPTAEGQLAQALAKAQAEFPPVVRSESVDTGKFKYAYAPLEEILKAVLPVLRRNGLTLTQPPDIVDGRTVLRTVLFHVGGARLEGKWPLQLEGLSPQQQGSLHSYVRRYSVLSLLGLAQEDDDAAGAEKASAQASRGRKKSGEGREAGSPPSNAPAPSAKGPPASTEQLNQITDLAARLVNEQVVTWPTFRLQLQKDYGTDVVENLSHAQAEQLVGRLQERLNVEFDSRVY